MKKLKKLERVLRYPPYSAAELKQLDDDGLERAWNDFNCEVCDEYCITNTFGYNTCFMCQKSLGIKAIYNSSHKFERVIELESEVSNVHMRPENSIPVSLPSDAKTKE